MAFQVPPLPYAYDALSPHMSAETLQFHHDKHHQAYCDAMNQMIQGTEYETMPLEDIVRKSFRDSPKLFNQAGQFYNHNHFWNWMRPNGGGRKLPGALEQQINSDLGSVDEFRTRFIDAGKTQFGSGWAWLAVNDGRLTVMNTPNGENPLAHGGTPLLGVDVWEHSYYIDYRNARPKYLETWFDNLVNWDYVAELFEKAR
jgi:Fe-Mn family superoxide dismutase